MPNVDQLLERALHHVSEGWLPPQQSVLQEVRLNLESGKYDEQRQLLAEDLKQDLSLYTFCLRELCQRLENAAPNHRDKSARTCEDVFAKADKEELTEIFSKSASQISHHSFTDISQYQALRIKESFLSAATAEVLAESLQLEPNTGYACSIMRQLGITLIAWNYPRLFARAVDKLSAGIPIDTSLQKILGFSPTLLGITLAQRWKLPDEIIFSMGVTNHKVQDERTQISGRKLAKICEVGEALARANNPEFYPTALADWEFAQEKIAEQLGPKGIEQVFARAKKCLGNLGTTHPELFGTNDSKQLKEHIVNSRHGCDLFENNSYLKKIPEELRQELRGLYANLKSDRIIKSNVERLVKQIIPQTEFTQGCIYMFEPGLRALVPAIKFGSEIIRECKPIKIYSTNSNSNLIVSAFSLKTPLREEISSFQGDAATTIAAAIGQFTPVGVLYLESPSSDTNISASSELMYIFSALRQALADCLNVS